MRVEIRAFLAEDEKKENKTENGLFLIREIYAHSHSAAFYERNSNQDAPAITDSTIKTTIIPNLEGGSTSEAQTQAQEHKLSTGTPLTDTTPINKYVVIQIDSLISRWKECLLNS